MASLGNHLLGAGSLSRLIPVFIQGGADLLGQAQGILQNKVLAVLGDSGPSLPPGVRDCGPYLTGVGWLYL